MTLSAGARLGPYEILSAIGAGGMGEVYRARDTRLGRTVALKLLPAELARDQSREARFEREARSASALSHANVVAVYDVGRDGDSLYLVTELVEGGNLRDLLDRGPVSVKRALEIAGQIASGLAAAHEQGIVHRDLKPENVLLAKTGEAKVADFGLAKLVQADDAADSRLPTSDGFQTSDGMVMGTVAYMSPEQASGRSVDFRSDQFAFGAVLYELLTGRPGFRKSSAPETMAAILRDEPEPIGKLNPSVPPHVSWMLERCLAKEPEMRYASTRDLARELVLVREHLSDFSSGATAPRPAATAASARSKWRPRTAAVAGAVAILVAAGLAALAWFRRPEAPPKSAVRFAVPPPPQGSFFSTFDAVTLAFSPDGSRIAFIAGRPEATRGILVGGRNDRQIWVRSVSTLEPTPLEGTVGATSLFWSPDSKSIGFVAGGQIKRIRTTGGAAAPVCSLPVGSEAAATWGDGEIVFASTFHGVIYRVPADGGSPSVIVRPAPGETRDVWPWFLPDGKSFLYVAGHKDGGGELKIASLDGSVREVGPIVSRVEYSDPGYLIFVKEGALFAQRFDAKTARLSGALIPLAPAVRYFYTSKWADFSASRSGNLVYGAARNLTRLSWFDPGGRSAAELGSGETGDTISVRISPDGRTALFDRARLDLGTFDVWSADLERGVETRLTSDPNTEFDPVWLPTGRQIVYSIVREYLPRLVRRDLAGGPETPLLPAGTFQEALGVTPDGKRLVFSQTGEHGRFGLWSLDLTRNGAAPVPLVTGEAQQEFARVSPDGKWIAYISNESGEWEAYTAALAPSAEKVRLSAGGAINLAWSHDGRKVYFTSPDRRMFEVDIRTSPSLEAGEPRPIFTLPALGWTAFDVAPDGRFLAAVPQVSAIASPLSVVLNWESELAR